jgi:hypothetical protein
MQSTQISEPQFEELVKLYSDKWWRLNNLYFIKDKSGKKILFKPNIDQETFFRFKHNRNIILKARQKGFTTLACIDALDDCLFNSYYEAGIIAHTVDDAEKIFHNKVKFAFDNLPLWLRLKRKPNTDKAGMLRFPNNSAISVDTSFRGGTLQKLHVSEYGKICRKYPEKAKEIKSGAFEAVAMDSEITVESTAEGMSGDFYKMCERAQLKNNEKLTALDFKFHFFAWWESVEYRLNPEGIDIPEEHEKYFKELAENHEIKLDAHQKAWYVKKSEEQEDMRQEYPSYPEEAFMASGRPVFNQQKIASRIKQVKDRGSELKTFIIKDMEGNEHTAQVKIFKHPDKAKAYAVAGDPAEGLEDGDDSALSVLNKDFEQCAAFAGKLDPDLFGALLVEVAKYYNNAIIAWEQNNHGHAVESAIRLRKYYKLYRRIAKEDISEEVKDKIGWLNTHKSKMEMLDDLKESFRDGSLEINDEETLRCMLTCKVEEDGNIIVNGKDRTVALGISIQAIKQATTEGQFQAKSPQAPAVKDVTRMTTEERLKFYKKRGRQ